MAGYGALAAVGLSVVNLLNQRIEEVISSTDPPLVHYDPTVVMAGSGDLYNMLSHAISVYCYRVSIDRETRPGRSGDVAYDGTVRIPLRMHFMISVWSEDAGQELLLLGIVAQILESQSVLTERLLDPSGQWRRGEIVEVVPDDAVESTSAVFEALQIPYRPSLFYLTRGIMIEGRPADADLSGHGGGASNRVDYPP